MILTWASCIGVLFVVIILFSVAWAGFLAAPWVPTRKKDIPRGLQLAKLHANDHITDLGCGDARILTDAVQKYGVSAVGYEVSIANFIWSKLRAYYCNAKIKQKKISIQYKNFFEEDVSKYSVIFCFLSTKAMKRLEPKLRRELQKGARVVSYAFAFPNWKPEKVDKPLPTDISIYLYRVE